MPTTIKELINVSTTPQDAIEAFNLKHGKILFPSNSVEFNQDLESLRLKLKQMPPLSFVEHNRAKSFWTRLIDQREKMNSDKLLSAYKGNEMSIHYSTLACVFAGVVALFFDNNILFFGMIFCGIFNLSLCKIVPDIYENIVRGIKVQKLISELPFGEESQNQAIS
jgi:hypothetical protein